MCPRCGCWETPAGQCSRCFLGRSCFDGISSRISLTLPGDEKFWHTSGLLCSPDDLHLRKPHLERKLGETLRDRPTIAHSQYLHSYLMKILSWWLGWFWYQIQGPWLQTHLCTPAIPRESCSRSRPQSTSLDSGMAMWFVEAICKAYCPSTENWRYKRRLDHRNEKLIP